MGNLGGENFAGLHYETLAAERGRESGKAKRGRGSAGETTFVRDAKNTGDDASKQNVEA
jgi:hypothetical protein